MAGLSLALEGIDGCGKSTQSTRLIAWLRGRDPAREVTLVREPGATILGERVRELLLQGDEIGPLSEMLLYMASRAELYERVVAPAVESGGIVLLDRSYFSTAAYQGAGLGLDLPRILDLSDWVTGGLAPDRVVLLRLDPEQAAARLAGGDDDRIESRDGAYFARVAAGYDALVAAEPGRFLVVDATQDEDAVFAAITEGLGDLV
jgi:dTMP kinase